MTPSEFLDAFDNGAVDETVYGITHLRVHVLDDDMTMEQVEFAEAVLSIIVKDFKAGRIVNDDEEQVGWMFELELDDLLPPLQSMLIQWGLSHNIEKWRYWPVTEDVEFYANNPDLPLS